MGWGEESGEEWMGVKKKKKNKRRGAILIVFRE